MYRMVSNKLYKIILKYVGRYLTNSAVLLIVKLMIFPIYLDLWNGFLTAVTLKETNS